MSTKRSVFENTTLEIIIIQMLIDINSNDWSNVPIIFTKNTCTALNCGFQSIDLEQLVLGQLMYNREACDLILPILNEKVFYLLKNQKVFKAINELWTKNNAVDIITVTKQLKVHKKVNLPYEIIRIAP